MKQILLYVFNIIIKGTYCSIQDKYKQIVDSYKIYKKARQILSEYNKQRDEINRQGNIIDKYREEVSRYNMLYNENKREILVTKIKECYGEDAWGDWWIDDDNKFRPVLKHNEIIFYLPHINFNEHIWKSFGELTIY